MTSSNANINYLFRLRDEGGLGLLGCKFPRSSLDHQGGLDVQWDMNLCCLQETVEAERFLRQVEENSAMQGLKS